MQCIPLDILNNYLEAGYQTATKVFNCVQNTQNLIYTIHGPSSEYKNKEILPQIESLNFSEIKNSYIPSGRLIEINPDNNISLLLSGLSNNNVVINYKINHLLIRKSNNINLHIKDGTISGLDILDCHNLLIKLPYHNFTNLEYTESINLNGLINEISQIHINNSIDVKVNNIKILSNPFDNIVFVDNKYYKKYSSKPSITIIN